MSNSDDVDRTGDVEASSPTQLEQRRLPSSRNSIAAERRRRTTAGERSPSGRSHSAWFLRARTGDRSMKRLPRDQQKELADNARLLRAWKKFHREELEEALAGPHGATIAELLTLLDRLELSSAAVLLNFIQCND